ncbi:uncharacterized protein LOC127861697 [Dreissena polymorpha]|uniref:uncharacterized protein LOC127861697 n=1 Tax=Dreissena polymorpha TaxID=45954 RepID=UPI002264A70A|nr:uncharacterized protein LOC127861697 [Dreissena polymorpha]
MEAGNSHEIRDTPFPTAAFHSSARMNGNRQKRTDANARMTVSERENLPYLRGLKLAHPITSEADLEINILIGADHYWDIVGDEIIRGDGPTAVGSRLGFLFCRQTTGSASLNDCLMSTPPELNDLTLLLMKFRVGKYGVVSDIEKAFLNVMLHEDDRDVTRFLWLSDPTDPCRPLTTYRFRAVLFGATCSPFILTATILKHLTLNKDNTAASTISNDLYVDSVVSSFTSETDVLKYFRHARDLMASGGFNLRSWTSNLSALRTMAEAEGVVERDAVIKVLGLLWEPEIDQMSFVMRSINSKEKGTKRGIFQQTSKIYVPLGMLAPVTIRAKLLIQDLWKRKYVWDTPIPEREQNVWLHIAEDLNEAMTTSFPRQYFPDNPSNMVDEDYV